MGEGSSRRGAGVRVVGVTVGPRAGAQEKEAAAGGGKGGN